MAHICRHRRKKTVLNVCGNAENVGKKLFFKKKYAKK